MEESLAMVFGTLLQESPFSGCYGVPPTSGISQHPQPFQRIDKTARRTSRLLLTPKCDHYRQRHQQITKLDQYTIGPYNKSQSIKSFLR